MRLALGRRAWWWAVLFAAAVGVSCWLLANWWQAIWPNLAASIIWGTPALATHHLLIRRHVDSKHAQTEARLDAQDEAHAEVAKRVGELHGLHIHGTWPEDRHRDR